jgi:hypothetical protein
LKDIQDKLSEPWWVDIVKKEMNDFFKIHTLEKLNKPNVDEFLKYKYEIYCNIPINNTWLFVNYTRKYWWENPTKEDFSTFVEAYFYDSESLKKEAQLRKDNWYPILMEKFEYVHKLFENKHFKTTENWEVSSF